MTYSEADEKIKTILDKDFLDKLVELGKLYGWSGDYEEIYSFIEDLYEHTDLELPDLTPYELEENKN